MACVQCERLRSLAVSATRIYHDLVADLECSYLNHDLKAALRLSARLENARRDRDARIAELTIHEKTHALRKPANAVPLSKRQSA